MGQLYAFDTDHAKKWGVDEAIMLHNLIFWIRHNRDRGDKQRSGHYWTYNTYQDWAKVFPFWTGNQVRRVLDSLIAQEVVITGNYNKMKYDRTLWYALVDEKLLDQPDEETPTSICENAQMDKGKATNGSEETATPIPDSNPDRSPDGNPESSSSATTSPSASSDNEEFQI